MRNTYCVLRIVYLLFCLQIILPTCLRLLDAMKKGVRSAWTPHPKSGLGNLGCRDFADVHFALVLVEFDNAIF